MKKNIISFLFSIFLLCGCQTSSSIIKEKLNFTSDYNQVCNEGLIHINTIGSSSSKKAINYLPRGYYGNRPYEGIFEFGGQAGDTKGKKCPPMQFDLDKDKYTLTFLIAFEKDPIDFPSNKIVKKLGYEISITSISNEVRKEIYLLEADRFSEIFNIMADTYAQYLNSDAPMLVVMREEKSLRILVTLNSGDKINYIRIHYGDYPQTFVNAGLFYYQAGLQYIDPKEEPKGDDCTRLSYTKKLGTHYEFNLISQYGYRFSKNYLLSNFIYKDETDNEQNHVTEILDPQDYFNTGHIAPIGSKYVITISVTNSIGNKSTLVFYLEVKDMQPPKIEKKNEFEYLKISYKEKLDEKFIKENFLINDNYDDICECRILTMDDEELPKDKIGRLQVKVEAKDTSNNISTYPFIIERIDDIPPVIELTYNEINIPKGKIITSENLLKMFTCYDEIDGDIIPVVLENTYSKNLEEYGEYEFIVSATDEENNTSKKKLRILINESDSPVFYVKESFITFIEGDVPSEKDIVQSLIREKILPDKNYTSSKIISGDTISSEMKAGDYFTTIQFFADDGFSDVVDLEIRVLEKEKSGLEETVDKDENEKEELSLWQRICKWFRDLWTSFLKLFEF